MRLYTRGGDQGETGLWAGERRLKSDLRIEVIGDLDELSASIGLAISIIASDHADLAELFTSCQNDLFQLGAELADLQAEARLTNDHVTALERTIDALTRETPPLRHFVLPGGAPGASQLHVARTVARRAERRCVALAHSSERVNPQAIVYLNRISDLLFAAARAVNTREGVEEPVWPGDGR